MAHFDFDSTKVMDDVYEPVPAGFYVAMIVDSVIHTTKDGTGKMIKYTFSITNGHYKGRQIIERYNVVNRNEMAEEIARKQLKRLCNALEKSGFKDTADLHHKELIIQVAIEPPRGEYGASNKIVGYKSTAMQATYLEPRVTSVNVLKEPTKRKEENPFNDDIPF